MMILGKYTDDENSYISNALANNAMYFDMGKESWIEIKKKYNLSSKEMFEYFNKPAIKDAFNKGIKFVFSHNPLDFPDTFLEQEWIYIKEILDIKDSNLKKKGEFWYVE